MLKQLYPAIVLMAALGSAPASAEVPGLGKPIAEQDLQNWNITVFPDGTNMPAGSGTAAQGAKVYAEKCAGCHGENAKGGSNPALISDAKIEGIEGPKSIANFWGYPTTLFDYIRRAMPWPAPRTLSNDEVYALCAYIFSINKLIGENETMNADTLPKVTMPNRDNFIIKFPDKI
jgi:cytochrome c